MGGQSYERMVVTRPDHVWLADMPRLSTLDPKKYISRVHIRVDSSQEPVPEYTHSGLRKSPKLPELQEKMAKAGVASCAVMDDQFHILPPEYAPYIFGDPSILEDNQAIAAARRSTYGSLYQQDIRSAGSAALDLCTPLHNTDVDPKQPGGVAEMKITRRIYRNLIPYDVSQRLPFTLTEKEARGRCEPRDQFRPVAARF